MRPKLKAAAKAHPPFAHKTSWVYPYWPIPRGAESETEHLPCYYFRLAILNYGNTVARQVEVFAKSLSRRRVDGAFETVTRFTPMNLMWAHEHKVYLPVLSPKMSKFCDLAHAIEPRHRQKLDHELPGMPAHHCVLALDLESEPKMKGHLLEPGSYRITLLLASENASPAECVVEFTFPGEWHNSEKEMFEKGFGIRVL